MNLEDIASAIKNCKKCGLSKTRLNTVPGSGSQKAQIMLVGEAPGREEDKTGVPFVGSAGKVLDRLLAGAGLSRKDVFITNVLKCRPPANRDPEESEVLACSQYLDLQIERLNPKIIVGLGRFASSYLLEKYGFGKQGITNAHGKVFRKSTLNGEIAIVPMFHPAAALYDQDKLPVMLEDFKSVSRLLG